jgi:hypothetical protein
MIPIRAIALAATLLGASPALAQSPPVYIRCDFQYHQGRTNREGSGVEYFRLSQDRIWGWDGDHFSDICANTTITCTITPARIEYRAVGAPGSDGSPGSFASTTIDRRSGDYIYEARWASGDSDSAEGRCNPSGPPPAAPPPRF